MSHDDLANVWGTVLVLTDGNARRRARLLALEGPNKNQADLGFRILQGEVRETFRGLFTLTKILCCGSEANAFAVTNATDGNLDLCMIGCGAYVAGTNGALTNWSSSSYSIHHSVATVTYPEYVQSEFTLSHTVGLPYHIKGVPSAAVLEDYEDKCLLAIHYRCLERRLLGAPFKTLLLELMLAGCGAILSDRCLEKLATLARHHKFSIVLDEIMTGARHGTMLLVQQKPKAFQDVVAYATMGKFPGRGMVMMGREEERRKQARHDADWTSARGPSNRLECYEATAMWRHTVNSLGNIQARHDATLKAVRCNEKETWGGGLQMYAPIRRTDSKPGLKLRLLPMLDPVPIEKIPITCKREECNKYTVNDTVMAAVIKWSELRPSFPGREELQVAIRIFLKKITSTGAQPGTNFRKKDFAALYFPEEIEKRDIRELLKLANVQGLVQVKRLYLERIDTVTYLSLAIIPWEIDPVRASFMMQAALPPGLSRVPNGNDYVGYRVAVFDDDEDTEPKFGQIVAFRPTTSFSIADHTWNVKFDDQHPLQSVGLMELGKMLDEYQEHHQLDTDIRRYNGAVVAQLVNGSKVVTGVVSRGKESVLGAPAGQTFRVKYDVSKSAPSQERVQWLPAADVERMISFAKTYHHTREKGGKKKKDNQETYGDKENATSHNH